MCGVLDDRRKRTVRAGREPDTALLMARYELVTSASSLRRQGLSYCPPRQCYIIKISYSAREMECAKVSRLWYDSVMTL